MTMHDLIEELRQQYTMGNDGGGRNGNCRVNNGNLLDLCRMAEFAEKELNKMAIANDELLYDLNTERNTSVLWEQEASKLKQQHDDLLAKYDELLAWKEKAQGIYPSLYLMIDEAIAKAKNDRSAWIVAEPKHSNTCDIHDDFKCSCGLEETLDKTRGQQL